MLIDPGATIALMSIRISWDARRGHDKHRIHAYRVDLHLNLHNLNLQQIPTINFQVQTASDLQDPNITQLGLAICSTSKSSFTFAFTE